MIDTSVENPLKILNLSGMYFLILNISKCVTNPQLPYATIEACFKYLNAKK